MGYLKKHAFVLIVLAILTGLYFFTRLYNLTGLPIFTDEAIYIRWAQIAHDDAAWRFISLTDGKQPSFVWVAMILLEFIKDPLVAGRLVSVLAGFVSMIGMFLLGRELFRNTKIGLITASLYVLYPFALVYDRMALYDSLVAMFIIWSLYFTVLLVRHVRLDLALIFGMIVGGGLLTKTNASFAFILLPFSLLLFPLKKKKFDKARLGKYILFVFAAVFIAIAMYSILRLSPFYHIIGEKNLTFIYSYSEWIQNPFAYVFGNLKGMIGWLAQYVTIPFLILATASFFVTRQFTREKLFLLAWFIVPFISLAFFGRVVYPRFILFMTVPLIVLGGFSLYYLSQYLKTNWLKVVVAFVFIAMWLVTDFFVITDMKKAAIASGDRDQFITGWAAGDGVDRTVMFLDEKAQNEKIFVGTQGTFGLMPYALEIYLSKNPNMTIKGYWPIDAAPPAELVEASKKMPTYVVFYQPCPGCARAGEAPTTWNLTKEFEVKKSDDTYYTVYKMNP